MSDEKESLRRLQDGLICLHTGLEPFVATQMREAFGPDWLPCAIRASGSNKGNPLDTYDLILTTINLLETMLKEWEGRFETFFKQRRRYGSRRFSSLVLECAEMLKEARHTGAHWFRGRLTDRTALRYLDAMLELLEALNAPRRTIKKLRYLYDEQLSTSGTNPPSTLRVARIIDPDSVDLYEIWLLHKSEFDEAVADSYKSFQQWIRDVGANDQLLPEEHELDDIMLALKSSNQVVGYLYAQHYIKRKLIFVSYIVTDRTFRDAHYRGAERLFGKLLKICTQRSSTWNAILGEVEQVKGRGKRHAQALFEEFQHPARQLAHLLKTSSSLFMIEFDYEQPIIRPEDLGRDRGDEESIKQKLLYFARDVGSLQKSADGHYRLQAAEALNIFDTLFLCVYGDAYPDAGEYQEYLRSVLECCRPRLVGGLSLVG